MPPYEGKAKGGLFGGRLAVSRRAPRKGVGYVGCLAALTPDRSEHAVEQLAAPADKGFADPVLVGSRCLADQHQRRIRIAVGKDRVGGGLAQGTSVERF